jgi:1-acyl-sn-glycerol-3-phosphate acyltransferase
LRDFSLFLRSLLFMIIMIVATIVWSCVCFLAAPFPYNQRYFVTSRWNVFVIWCAKVICGIRYEIKGAENFPDAPAIVLSKHQSAWETIFLLPNLPRPLVYVFKKEILYIPFFGWGMALLRMIPIDRSKGKHAFKHVVAHGKKRLADGQWIIMFPEGTRIPIGQVGQYKSGGTRLAIQTGAVVVPIAHNSGECWPKQSFIKRPGLITVSIGKPISPEGQTPDSMMQQVENWIESEMRVISPHAYSAGSMA